MTRPRVLISAFSCNPERGSEPGVGHFFVSELAKHCDLTVITEEVENRAAIERRQRVDDVYASVDFRFIKWPWLDESGKRIDDRGSYHFYRCLRLWERDALQLAKNLTAGHRFDLTHHVTMGGYREPGFLWQLPLPFVWGPAGGHVQMPWRYFPMLGWRGWLQYGVRNLGNAVHARFHPRVNAAARTARAVVTSSSLDARAFERFQGIRATTIAEHGTEPTTRPPRRLGAGEILRIAWSGVHVPRKALPILLHAISQLPRELPVQLDILGDGPETARWKALALRLGVVERCIWHGRLPLDEATAVMRGCDVLALTSLIDATSSVLHEALSDGMPVVCHNACGFPDVISDGCGVLVPLHSPTSSIRGFADALSQLARSPEHYNRLAAGAHARAREITAGHRAEQMLEVYESILGRRISRETSSLEAAVA
jgi:glycosyltransferase involved in cell wall biosynthesis